MLNHKDYFVLRHDFDRMKTSLSRMESLYFSTYIENVFFRSRESNSSIETLFNEFGPAIGDSIKAELLAVQEDNYAKMFQYA